MTLEEKQAIEKEVMNSGIVPAKPQAQRDEQHDTTTEIPGRDSGFCSEQDQLGQQAQGIYNKKKKKNKKN